jgi:tetratricopeptide (TPR) repeat protein
MEIAGAWRSRLDWGDTGATESDVIDDLTAVEKSARDELPAAKLRIFQQRLPRRHSPVNDCDLHLARALFLGLKGDFKGAQTLFDALSPVNPDDAQRSRIEGLMDYDRKNYVDAQLELERAVELDATLSAELKPIIDECAKAPPPP